MKCSKLKYFNNVEDNMEKWKKRYSEMNEKLFN